jgi:tripartite ATP-independent transporter DctM subunit
MGIAGMLGLCLVGKTVSAGLTMVGIAPYHSMLSFVLVSVPMFVLMGEITSKSGISRDLFEAAAIWLGRVPGGLAVASVSGCAGFAAICGESLPTAVTMSSVALPEMQRLKYDDSLACGSLAAGGTLGILIPPSVGFIFYSVITEQSVGMLFMAGVIPGLLLTALFISYIVLTALRHPARAPRLGKTSWGEKIRSFRKIAGFFFIFLSITAGIMSGVMNPTEASAFGVVSALLVAVAGRRFSVGLFVEALRETVNITSRLLFILTGVAILGYFLAATRLPNALGSLILGLEVHRLVTLLVILGVWVVLGCVMNVIPMILLTLPAIFPTVEMLGFDPIWFGVLAVIVMEMGQLTPPVGIVCFAVSTVGKVRLETVFRGIFPFFLCMWIAVGLLVAFPGIATWLPYTLFR